LMDLVAPSGPVYQAGTLSGNPLAMTAGLWSLNRLTPRLFSSLQALGSRHAGGLADAAREAGVGLHVNAAGSVLTPFFTAQPVRDYASALTSNTKQYGTFFSRLLGRGVLPPPSAVRARVPAAPSTALAVR